MSPAGVYPRASLAERFERFVDRSAGPEACHLWLGQFGRKGYGRIWKDGRNVPATHVALELAGRPLDPGQQAMHSCDNPPCVNADHLAGGTLQDNIADRHAKGRDARGDANGARLRPETRARGEANGLARLDATKVHGIRISPLSSTALAAFYGVSRSTIRDVRLGKTWAHIK